MAKVAPGGSVSVRINPGLGSGSTKRTNTGGPASSFGIWHAYLNEVKKIAAYYKVQIARLHTHIGSGSDPEVWKRVTRMSLDIASELPNVKGINLGGGFKVSRMPDEPSTDLQDVGSHVRRERSIPRARWACVAFEVEPGTLWRARGNRGDLC